MLDRVESRLDRIESKADAVAPILPHRAGTEGHVTVYRVEEGGD